MKISVTKVLVSHGVIIHVLSLLCTEKSTQTRDVFIHSSSSAKFQMKWNQSKHTTKFDSKETSDTETIKHSFPK